MLCKLIFLKLCYKRKCDIDAENCGNPECGGFNKCIDRKLLALRGLCVVYEACYCVIVIDLAVFSEKNYKSGDADNHFNTEHNHFAHNSLFLSENINKLVFKHEACNESIEICSHMAYDGRAYRAAFKCNIAEDKTEKEAVENLVEVHMHKTEKQR